MADTGIEVPFGELGLSKQPPWVGFVAVPTYDFVLTGDNPIILPLDLPVPAGDLTLTGSLGPNIGPNYPVPYGRVHITSTAPQVFNFKYDFEDVVNVGDSVSIQMAYSDTLTDTVNTGDTASASMTMMIEVTDGAAAGDTPTASMVYSLLITDGAGVTATFEIDGVEYTALVLNTENFGRSRYTNWNFNSMCHYNGNYYGALSDGIYQFGGDLDVAATIDASILTGITDFDVHYKKALPQIYIGLRNDGKMVLKMYSTLNSGVRIENWYELKRTSNAIRQDRVRTAKGVRSTYWQLELINKDGADFELDTIELNPVILTRKRM